MYPEKPNVIFFNVYRNYVEPTKDFNRLERIEKIEEIRRVKNRLTVIENEVINELEQLHKRT